MHYDLHWREAVWISEMILHIALLFHQGNIYFHCLKQNHTIIN